MRPRPSPASTEPKRRRCPQPNRCAPRLARLRPGDQETGHRAGHGQRHRDRLRRAGRRVREVGVDPDMMGDAQRTTLRRQLRGDQVESVVPFAQPGSLTRVYCVASGKGGVGKSSVTVNLAAALATRGLSVGYWTPTSTASIIFQAEEMDILKTAPRTPRTNASSAPTATASRSLTSHSECSVPARRQSTRP